MNKEVTFKGARLNGIAMIIMNVLLIGISIFLFAFSYKGDIFIIAGIVLLILNLILWFGFVLIEPNEACAMVFFGVYKGTVKENGFFFVNPFYKKKKLSLRARNMNIEPIKVNDKIGNPVMIGLVLVWKIEDTYKVLFDVESDAQITISSEQRTAMAAAFRKANAYRDFVRIQSDSALRRVAGLYPYDNFDNEHHDATLRSSSNEINKRLEQELSERLSIAGIKVVEARINYLAYASEIASVMLRRQQAAAIIAAREKIVEGAVGMVQLALNKLADEDVVNLDEDKKAAMVSNLMVVLCADESAHPVINAGTLHQ